MARPRNAFSPKPTDRGFSPRSLRRTTGTQTNAGPIAVTFPVRVQANSHLTLTIPVSDPDNLTYQVNLQVQGW